RIHDALRLHTIHQPAVTLILEDLDKLVERLTRRILLMSRDDNLLLAKQHRASQSSSNQQLRLAILARHRHADTLSRPRVIPTLPHRGLENQFLPLVQNDASLSRQVSNVLPRVGLSSFGLDQDAR